MRPYLAILKDSFREAMVSRVLWVLLLLATLLLAAILPLSLSEDVAYQIDGNTLRDATKLARKIKAEHDGEVPAPGKQVWSLLDGATKARFEAAGEEEGDDGSVQALEHMEQSDGEWQQPFWNDLNELLSEPDLWNEDDWLEVRLTEEARELIDRGPDAQDEKRLGRLNRLLLEAAYPGQINVAPGTALYVAYFGFGPDEPLPYTLDGTLKTFLSILTDRVMGVVGVMIAILVTSSMIPHTFEAGAIDLLLSKPVSRPLVFLTKFVGGCTFILLLSTYFVGGLWLLAVIRYDYWSGSLLWCIPVLMFLFALYYSISALAGMVWRNAIVAVVMSSVFWFFCIGVWTVKVLFCDTSLTQQRIGRIVETDEGLFVYRDIGFMGDFTPYKWDQDEQKWQRQSASGLPKGVRLGTSLIQPQIKHFSEGTTYFSVGDEDVIEVRREGVFVSEGIGSSGPRRAPVGRVKTDADATNGDVSQDEKGDASQNAKADSSQDGKVVESKEPQRLSGELALAVPFAAAMDPQTAAIVIYDGRRLVRLDRDETGQYKEGVTREFESSQAGVVAFSGPTVVLAQENGDITLFDAVTLDPRHKPFQPEGPSPPYMAQTSTDGRYCAVLFHHNVLWLYDTEEERPLDGISGQGEIVSVAFGGETELLVAHHYSEITRYGLDPVEEIERIRPQLDWFGRVYWYGIRVVYDLFPKPGELGDLVAYLVSGSKSAVVNVGPMATDDLQARLNRAKLNIWPPVWSNLAFLVLMLTMGCWYVQRKEF